MVDGSGYLYVIQFDCDVVKVGKTANPSGRMAQHISDASAFRAKVAQAWFSEAHQGYEANESLLISYAVRDHLGHRARREYFHGGDFGRMVELAEFVVSGVDAFPTPSDPEGDAAAIAAIDSLRQALRAVSDMAVATDDLDRCAVLARGLGELCTEAQRGAARTRLTIIARMYEAEGHSTTRLGDRAGLTKQRADQLINQAKRAGIVVPPKEPPADTP